MSLQSDVTVNFAKFDPKNVAEDTKKFSDMLVKLDGQNPNWWDTGAAEYRQMRLDGRTSFPAPTVLPNGQDSTFPSRESGRTIPVRIFKPSSGQSKGSIMHIHGGGWVLMNHQTSDPLLNAYAEMSGCTVISVDYRLAPEHPYPAPVEDCFDAAEHLVKNSEKEYGGPFRFLGGESAGGHLSMVTTFHLLRTFPELKCPALLLNFGAYDLSMLPQAVNLKNPPILDIEKMTHFTNAFLPGMSLEQKRDPKISPFYEDMYAFRGRLPKALFTVGTNDALLDDSVLMSVKWQMAGGEAILRAYEGDVHGFTSFPQDKCRGAKQCFLDIKAFIDSCM